MKSSEESNSLFSGKKVPKEKYQKALEELEKANADKEHWKNEYYRAYADMQNLRRSIEEDKRVAIRYRSEGFLEKLLPALDAFRMALVANPESQEAKNYRVGFQYIYNQLQQALEDEGVKEVSPKVGDSYDIGFMHAVDVEERDDLAPNTVTQVHSSAYKLHDRLVRPSMVTVSKKPQAKENDEDKPEQGEDKAHQA